MILEVLRPEPELLRATAAALRIAYYVASLRAAGLAIFSLGFGSLQDPQDVAACRQATLGMVVIGLAASGAWLTSQVALASDGDVLDVEIWGVMLTSRPGVSVLITWAGLLAIGIATWIGRSTIVLGVAGILTVAGSFTAVGHTTQHQPRALLAAALILHLLAVSFWAGSLWPLALAAKRGGPTAARLIEGWARAAARIVGALLLAGSILAWLLVGSVEVLATTAYGWALMIKVALVGVLLGFAAWHKLWLTPALAANAPGSGTRLAASIGWETVVMILVFWAVAEMTSTSPQGEG
ncbi:copper resistance protein [Roseomonas sp. KE2513]|uniref:copper resistance D family protein n=1 Tax=Roseomonas sp. KE2513 TaxID=2479202 RepID=UPI0018DF1592|nr:CopD family protein [Roseomonas sp. KE2513]MBI0537408.1 copper resistance protein [Roseomonas sp. KE2513]